MNWPKIYNPMNMNRKISSTRPASTIAWRADYFDICRVMFTLPGSKIDRSKEIAAPVCRLKLKCKHGVSGKFRVDTVT